ncbi:PTS mannose transporter subunit IID [Lacticaseibacillus zeae]|uniref:PTS mannose transporter subunit IID n=1 Tax=Lacticaseibacillus zeae TaxID=57037 RepID=A0A5R8LN14_LACZE|nr:PTS mannose transporter subunit IID [Lacticaseibacillus zeae]TLF38601.1 PTS mannose transporter subunit IID [Lacticaseibacillus zeae]
MKRRWVRRLLRRRLSIASVIFLVLLMGSLALSFQYRHSATFRQVHDPVMMAFIGATPDRFASSQVLWLFLWVGFMTLPIFIGAGVTNAYQDGLYTYVSLRIRPRLSAYLWPLKQLLLMEVGFLFMMGVVLAVVVPFIWPEQHFFAAGWFTLVIVMSQVLLVVFETVVEGYFGVVIGVVSTLVVVFLSFLQVPLMPLRFAIGSMPATNHQLLNVLCYQMVLILLLTLIQVFYMPGRWGRYVTERR